MKRAIIIISVIIGLLPIFNNNSYANYPISVGPYLGIKGGVNAADVPNGTYNGFAFCNLPEIGISSYFPFVDKSSFGGGLNLAYSTDAFLTEINDTKTTYQFNYFKLSPHLYASGFILGLNIGIPLSGTSETKNITTDAKIADMSTAIDIKIGGVITVFSNQIGRFNIVIEGSYSLSGILQKKYLDEYNYHPGQMWLGLNYMFNVQKPDEGE